jgi:hypothetical protein
MTLELNSEQLSHWLFRSADRLIRGAHMQMISIPEFLIRLGSALLLGTLVGLERQWRQRMAGTRTNALVAAGASAFVMCAFLVRDTSRGEAQIVSYVRRTRSNIDQLDGGGADQLQPFPVTLFSAGLVPNTYLDAEEQPEQMIGHAVNHRRL